MEEERYPIFGEILEEKRFSWEDERLSRLFRKLKKNNKKTGFDELYQEKKLEILKIVADPSTFMSLLVLELYRKVLPEGTGFNYPQLKKITGKLLGNEIDPENLESLEKYQLINRNSDGNYLLTGFGEWFVKYKIKAYNTLDYHFFVSSLKEEIHKD